MTLNAFDGENEGGMTLGARGHTAARLLDGTVRRTEQVSGAKANVTSGERTFIVPN